MPQSVSAKKSLRQNQRNRMRNRTRKSALKTQMKRFHDAVAAADAPAAAEELKKTQRLLDRAAASHLVHKNKAAHQKAQLAKEFNAMAAKSE